MSWAAQWGITDERGNSDAGFAAQELTNWAYLIRAIGSGLHAINAWRQRAGRLAEADDNHPDQMHTARQRPPIRLMTADEQRKWQSQVPAELLASTAMIRSVYGRQG